METRLTEKPYRIKSFYSDMASHLDNMVNEWLGENPGIEIVNVTNISRNNGLMTFTILYKKVSPIEWEKPDG